MLPVILVAVGAYLIGDSVLSDKKYAKGGMSDGGEKAAKKRLEELRKELRAEKISYSELSELESLKKYIDDDDVELLQAAGVPEYDDEDDDDDKYAKGGKIRSQKEFNELVAEKEKLVKNLSPKEVAEMWNKNSNSPSKMTDEEAKNSTSKMYLRDLLVEKELTKAEHNKYFAKGGYMAKGGDVRFYEGQSVLFKSTNNPKLDKAVRNLNNKYANKELVIEKITIDKPYNTAKVFDRNTGEKLPFEIKLNPRYVEQYAKGGSIAEDTTVEVGEDKISVIKNRKEKTGFAVYVQAKGYAPMTLDVYATKEAAMKKAKALAKKEGYKFVG